MRRLPPGRFWSHLAALLSVCAYPTLYVYFHNIREAALAQVVSPILTFLAIGIVAWLAFRMLSGSMAKGAFTALVFMFVFMNYSHIDCAIRWLVPDWRWWRIAPLLLFLHVNLALALRAGDPRREKDALCSKLTIALGSAYVALSVFQAVGGMYTLARMPRAQSEPATADVAPAKETIAVNAGRARPNFYFFVFDEYSRQDVLKEYTGHDNMPFLRGLESRGFNVSCSSHTSVASTRAAFANLLHYATRYKTPAEAPASISRPPLFDLFRNAGYRIYAKLHEDFGIDRDLVDVGLKTRTVLTAMSIGKTVAEASFIAYLHQGGNEARRMDALNLFGQAADTIVAKTREPRFLLLHFMLPHEPFIFDEHGDPVACENMHNWADTGFYVRQLRFTSDRISHLADLVLERDPAAVVLIQSDHGARYFSGMPGERALACLNVLYLAGKRVDIEGLSTVNTLRLALDFAFEVTLEME